MPEGPEVRHFTDQVRALVKGLFINDIWAAGGRFEKRPPSGLSELLAEIRHDAPLSIGDVRCHGKLQYWSLENDWTMLVTFGMSGSWRRTFMPHTAMTLSFCYPTGDYSRSGEHIGDLHFVDPRRFGTIKFVQGDDALEKKFNSLGVDLMTCDIDELSTAVREAVRSKKWADKEFCQLLMDQGVVAGIGNYIKAEALYATGISPRRKCNDLQLADALLTVFAARDVALRSYAAKGNTVRTYAGIDGEAGTFARELQVYGKKTDPSGRAVVKEETADGRTTHWVPELQK
jgi:DNA-formamidopyrimidine glycosylase